MKSILIKDTTKEEREQIIAESVGNIDDMCDGYTISPTTMITVPKKIPSAGRP